MRLEKKPASGSMPLSRGASSPVQAPKEVPSHTAALQSPMDRLGRPSLAAGKGSISRVRSPSPPALRKGRSSAARPDASAATGASYWTQQLVAETTRSRFINADGQPFVSHDSPHVREFRCANELLTEAVARQSLRAAELFVMSSRRSRQTVEIDGPLKREMFAHVRLGEQVRIGKDVNLLSHGFIEIHDKAQLGDGVTVDTVGHPNDPTLRHTAITGTVIIQEGAMIGAGTVIVARAGETLVIGKNAKIANDSIVVRSVGDLVTVAGVPAKPVEGEPLCDLRREEFRPDGFTAIDTLQQARELFGAEADVKLPIFFKGDLKRLIRPKNLSGRIGINREAMFDLKGDLTIHPPFQMASRASVQVLENASADIQPGAFLYTACRVLAKDKLRIGENAIVAAGARVDRDVKDNTIVVSDNRVTGLVTKKTYAPVPEDWRDRSTLQPKVDDYTEYKASKVDMSFEEIKQYAVESAKALFQFRTRPFAPESLFMSEEFAELEKQRVRQPQD